MVTPVLRRLCGIARRRSMTSLPFMRPLTSLIWLLFVVIPIHAEELTGHPTGN